MARETNEGAEQRRTTHMVRLSARAYDLLQKAYESFCMQIAAHPEKFPLYADRRVTISEVLALCVEGQLATGGEQ